MSKKEYKRLGDYIREVNVRNRDLAVSNLLGVSIQKTFIKSIANTIGTDMSTYKIVLRGQFAYGPVTSRNGDKVSIALLSDDENAIISQAYAVFEVIDRSKLLPEYLMMWFRRPEFDRYARFKSHGSAREVFDWDEMCNVTLPIPAIEVQRKIVAEYEAISNRIALNEQICKKLEDTAQAIYHKMFVDDIDPENLPDGWRMGTIGDLFELQRGFDLPSQNRITGSYPIYASTGIAEYHNCYKVKSPGVVTGRSGSIGEVFYCETDFWPLNTTLWIKEFKIGSPLFSYYKLKELDLAKRIAGFAAVPTLNRNDVHSMVSIIPPNEIITKFENIILVLNKKNTTTTKATEQYKTFQTLLLSRLTRE